MRHIHLDPLGGIAGDMFVACLLDLAPECREPALEASQRLSGAPCSLVEHPGAMRGLRFAVGEHAPNHHAHTAWREIRQRLERASLPDGVRRHAVGIFACLADAEARVHGVEPDAVAFHEVGAADSVADIVAAAWAIDHLSPANWSVGPLPLGGGTVRTAHGVMPVPAPATSLLIEGMATVDDGIAGERVTPTGAAILRYLAASGGRRPAGILRRSGTGFGTRVLPDRPNCLRAIEFEVADQTQSTGPSAAHRRLSVISFEVDDQSGEELAAGLARLRAMPGVHDLIQVAAFGKKGRFAVQVQLLLRPDCLDEVAAACFDETTTIGLRTHEVEGRALPRRIAEVPLDRQTVRVKLSRRPGSVTGKVEAADLETVAGHASRTRLRRDAERLAEQHDRDVASRDPGAGW